MLHHISLGTQDIENAARFYDAVLEPLGYVRVWSDLRPGGHGQAVGYGNNYFAAFVIDPDGHRLEAVCNGDE
jgi:catechol 2,3-dioxygenase-like lactoylglutathione lyase family enzyme